MDIDPEVEVRSESQRLNGQVIHTPAVQRRVLRKIDCTVLPAFALCVVLPHLLRLSSLELTLTSQHLYVKWPRDSAGPALTLLAPQSCSTTSTR